MSLDASTLRRSARLERLKARAPRVAFWSVVCVLAIGGLKQIVAGDTTSADTAAPTAGISDQAAEELAIRFARAYLTYDPARPDQRERALSGLVPDELAGDGGRLPAGPSKVTTATVAQHQVALAGGVIVVVAAELDGEADPLYLGVPVDRRAGGALYVSGYPSLVGPPTVARPELPLRDSLDDPAVEKVVARVLDNYLSSSRSDLTPDLAPGAEVSPPLQPLELVSLDELVWAAGEGEGAVLATITARDLNGGVWTLTYELGVDIAAAQDGSRGAVSFISTVPTES